MPAVKAAIPIGTPANQARKAPAEKRVRKDTQRKSQTDADSKPPRRTARVESRQYAPFRALGLVTDRVPVSVQALGQTLFVATSVGSTFHVYDVQTMQLKMVGDALAAGQHTTALLAHGEMTFVGTSDGSVGVYRRNRLVRTWPPSDAAGAVRALVQFGEQIVVLHAKGEMAVWPLRLPADAPLQPLRRIGLCARQGALGAAAREPVAAVHPPTWTDRIVVGFSDGSVEVWHVRKLRRTRALERMREDGSGAAVTALATSPALDVVAVGFADGLVSVHNMALDENVMRLRQRGAATAVSFRTDATPQLVTASADGDAVIWNLETQQVATRIPEAHAGGIASAVFLPGQTVLLTSGADNAVRQWALDVPDAPPRLLRQRSGHSAPPTQVRFHGDSGTALLSAGADRSLRVLSVIRDSQNVALSQGAGLARKLRRVAKAAGSQHEPSDLGVPAISGFSASDAREKQWDCIVTCHERDSCARTWSLQRKALGKHLLRASATVESVAVSRCGNFALLGTTKGHIEVFSMQSGERRRTLEGPTLPVTGLATDAASQTVVAASLDGRLRIWALHSGTLEGDVELGAAATALVMAPAGVGLAAVACDDWTVRVVDVEARRVVRVFDGMRGRVTDVAFTPDVRQVLVAAADASLRTFDVPTGHLVDILRLSSVPTSLAVSPSGDLVATTHVGELGVFLWLNRGMYESGLAAAGRVVTAAEEDAVLSAAAGTLPTTGVDVSSGRAARSDGSSDDEASDDDAALESQSAKIDPEHAEKLGVVPVVATEQLQNDLLTLSAAPSGRWATLLHLDMIKKRNRPAEPPKKPAAVPFFIPTLPGVAPTFAPPESAAGEAAERTALAAPQLDAAVTPLQLAIRAGIPERKYLSVFSELAALSPASVDLALRALTPVVGVTAANVPDDIFGLLDAFRWGLEVRRDFDAVEAYLGAFLRIHQDLVVSCADAVSPFDGATLRDALSGIMQLHSAAWQRLEAQFRRCRCAVDFLWG